ncbi:hypothetical protein ACJQWY_02190 [Weissella kandleri]|uniref:hypothetical protein n=1 Tax=Weissella kandleri TaxID=1616 RepID=UPI00387E7DA8
MIESEKTFKAFGKEVTLQRTIRMYKSVLNCDLELANLSDEYQKKMESEDEFSYKDTLDFEFGSLDIKSDFLKPLFDLSDDEIENEIDPKDILDLYNAVFYWVTSQEEKNAENDDPSLVLESMKRFNK